MILVLLIPYNTSELRIICRFLQGGGKSRWFRVLNNLHVDLCKSVRLKVKGDGGSVGQVYNPVQAMRWTTIRDFNFNRGPVEQV